MQRDGALTSLWQSSVPTYQTVAHKDPLPQDADVVIVGGGITGITTAYLLQQGGKKCVIVESHTLGFGTTGGTTAHINTFMDNPYNQVIKDFGEMNAQVLAQGAKQALELIEKNVQELKIDCEFIKLPGFIYAVDDDQQKQLDEIAEASNKVGVEMLTADTIPVPIPFVKSVTVPGQAQFNPVKYIYALAKAFEEAGGIIVQHCRVTKVDEAETKTVHTQLGEIKTPLVIYATHIPPGINLLHLRCAPYRSYAIAVKLEDEKYPEALAYDLYDPYHYFRTQEVNGELYLVAGGEDHKTAHEENTNACFRKLEAYVRKFYNVRNVSFQWSSQYYEPADGLAYIGHLPMSAEGMYVATGFGGNGMTYGTLSAIVLSEQILNGVQQVHFFV
jgi:glycine/D-amino acid oxidase-like deaminating enzyme